MTYQHYSDDGKAIPLVNGKVVCVGRNYVEHVKELNNAMPDEPVLFIKPDTALCHLNEPLVVPAEQGEVHHELELAVLIKSTLRNVSEQDVDDAIWGVGIGIDLTLRDKQTMLKQKGLPWERAKAFDASSPLSGFVELSDAANQTFRFSLKVNGEARQIADTQLMIWNIRQLLADISQVFTLNPGDVVLTGTPHGVGKLVSGDTLEVDFAPYFNLTTQVV